MDPTIYAIILLVFGGLWAVYDIVMICTAPAGKKCSTALGVNMFATIALIAGGITVLVMLG